MSGSANYDDWSREALVAKIAELEAKVAKETNKKGPAAPNRAGGKAFDFSKAQYRPIALKLSYMGADYHGFAAQDADTVATIESELFKALRKGKLVDESVDRQEWNYSRCGRTDAGVSAFGQVVALRLRSSLPKPAPSAAEGEEASSKPEPTDLPELPYMSILNRILPPAIRILAWSPVADDFSARFDCRGRKYRYFFPRLPHYDLEAMRSAAQLLVGTHDFRNFCKVDPSKGPGQSFMRTIVSTAILEDIGPPPQYDSSGKLLLPGFAAFEVMGTAFLWHQVRCLMAVLFLIAEGKEPVSVISEMLDIDRQPRAKDGKLLGRPMYTMAPELPLVLVDCFFDEDRVKWRMEDDEVAAPASGDGPHNSDIVAQSVFSMWKDTATQDLLLRELTSYIPPQSETTTRIRWDVNPGRRYKHLLERGREPPIEDRLKPIQRNVIETKTDTE